MYVCMYITRKLQRFNHLSKAMLYMEMFKVKY